MAGTVTTGQVIRVLLASTVLTAVFAPARDASVSLQGMNFRSWFGGPPTAEACRMASSS